MQSTSRDETGFAESPNAGRIELELQIQLAGRVVEDGRPQDARRRCAALLHRYQPRIVADPTLLNELAAVLLRARGFEQLRRLFAAAYGRDLRFAPLAIHGEPRCAITAVHYPDGSTADAIDSLFADPSRAGVTAAASHWTETAAPGGEAPSGVGEWHNLVR